MPAYRALSGEDESPWKIQRLFKILAFLVTAALFVEYTSDQLFVRNTTLPWVQPEVIYQTPSGNSSLAQRSSIINSTSSNSSSVEKLKNETCSILRENLETNSTLCSNETVTKLCPLIPPRLVGRMKVLRDNISFSDLEALHQDMELGGKYHPEECLARHRVAIIVPYRDREEHLREFLHNIHPMLKRQQLDYEIFIVEQSGRSRFNRAKLMNIGYLEANKVKTFDCYIFHDIDLIAEDDRNLYSCPDQPRHMSVAVDSMGYKLPYANIFGGVSALSKKHMQLVNGFSNEFWGWGGEDDDMSARIRYHKLKITRYPAKIARYSMLKHKKDTPNPERYKSLRRGRLRYKTDGINSCKYRVVEVTFKKLFTWILVDVLAPPVSAKKQSTVKS